MHVVFKHAGSDKAAVIGVLFDVGKENAFLSALTADGLPEKRGEEVDAHSRLVNIGQALPDASQYYTYPGSLTTPPCSENVTWFVLKGRAEMSAEQLAAFRRVLGDNARPVQKPNHRVAHETVSGAK
jgi:carbonic anhydrase